jgi:undecaprenyl-diphosphatase
MTACGRSQSRDERVSTKSGLIASIGRVLRRTGSQVVAFVAILGRAPRPSSGRASPWPSSLRLLAGAAITIAMVAAAMVYLDAWAIDQVRLIPFQVIQLFDDITDLGLSGWFLFPTSALVIAIAAVATPALGRIANLVLLSIVVRLQFVFFAVAAPGLIFTVLKRLVGRVRPSMLGPFAYMPFSWQPEYASFPSGHSTTAFSAAIALGALFPRARPLFWLYAVTIAASRVIITVHYPSDVIAGALVGGFGAILVRNWFAARRLGFAVAPDGRIVTLPGPSLGRIRMVARKLSGA